MRLALPLLLAVTGCAHRGGLRYPGPMAHMGEEPLPYVEVLAAEESDRVGGSEEADEDEADRERRRRGGGDDVARAAARFVGDRRLVVHGESYRYDCSGLVIAAHARAGHTVSGSSKDLYERARDEGVVHEKKRPYPGDVAFFDNSYDRNHNGRRDDTLTHVAIVESVDSDGTITLIHKGSKGIVRIEMNLKHPHDRLDDNGAELNDYLRAARDKDGGPVLTGELWRAFGSLWAIEEPAYADGN